MHLSPKMSFIPRCFSAAITLFLILNWPLYPLLPLRQISFLFPKYVPPWLKIFQSILFHNITLFLFSSELLEVGLSFPIST